MGSCFKKVTKLSAESPIRIIIVQFIPFSPHRFFSLGQILFWTFPSCDVGKKDSERIKNYFYEHTLRGHTNNM